MVWQSSEPQLCKDTCPFSSQSLLGRVWENGIPQACEFQPRTVSSVKHTVLNKHGNLSVPRHEKSVEALPHVWSAFLIISVENTVFDRYYKLVPLSLVLKGQVISQSKGKIKLCTPTINIFFLTIIRTNWMSVKLQKCLTLCTKPVT